VLHILIIILCHCAFGWSGHDTGSLFTFWRAGFYPANQSNLKSIQKALIGWKKVGPLKKPLLFWSCKQVMGMRFTLPSLGRWLGQWTVITRFSAVWGIRFAVTEWWFNKTTTKHVTVKTSYTSLRRLRLKTELWEENG